MSTILAVIPARYGSSRLPGKPLVLINSKPMIQRVYEGALGSGVFDEVVVATDDRRIFDVVQGFGAQVVMTRADHPSGTDRVAEVAESLVADVVVNVQGDLPFVDRSLLEPPLTAMLSDASIPMATVSVPIVEREKWLDPNVVKVVTDERGFALYFSRAPIPARRQDVASEPARDRRGEDPDRLGASGDSGGPAELGRQHVGLYAYRRDFLLRFASWEPTPLERIERLEQLRALERGVRLFVASVSGVVIEVDTPEDLKRAARSAGSGEGP